MLNIGEGSSKYVTFWEVTKSADKYSDVKLSSSTKDKDGNWESSNWFARFVGKAHNSISKLSEKDKIEITQGGIKKHYDKDKKKEYFNMVVFDFNVMGEKKSDDDFVTVESDDSSDDLPF